jgi:hypothetical protein
MYSDIGAYEYYTMNPPVITNVRVTPDIQEVGKCLKISCDITDNGYSIDTVWVTIIYPDNTTLTYSMDQGYSLDQTYPQIGTYQFLIGVRDIKNNTDVSTWYTFHIIPVLKSAIVAGFITIGTEGFESYTAGHYDFPAGWIVTPTNPASTWFVYGTGTTNTPKCQETNSLDTAQNELLTSPASNFVGMTTIKLKYTAYFYRSSTVGDSYVEVLGSLDGGATWPTLITTYTATGGVSYNEDLNISSWAANQPSVTIGFRFVSDADLDLTDYFYLDRKSVV